MTVTQTQAWYIVGFLTALTVLACIVYWRAARAVEAQRSRSRASAQIPTYTAEEIDAILNGPGIKVIVPKQA